MSRRIQDKKTETVYTPENHLQKAISKPKNETPGKSNIKGISIMILVLIFIGMIGTGFFSQKVPEVKKIDYEHEIVEFDTSTFSVTMFSSPGCGCCHLWAEYLENYDVSVFITETAGYIDEKRIRNIPDESFSCHTAIFGDYFVEGHVPMTAINKLLTELPDIDGIALPQMPIGSPGMDGEKTQTFYIQAIVDGQVSYTFMSI